jgi:hypothetical protein
MIIFGLKRNSTFCRNYMHDAMRLQKEHYAGSYLELELLEWIRFWQELKSSVRDKDFRSAHQTSHE